MSMPPGVSVCLCTLNGERFLPDLLASISGQTRPPDELVVCDDGSTDGTVPLLEAMAVNAAFPVHVYGSSHRLGIASNFERALSVANGDILFPCDQDDVWHPRKIEKVYAVLTGEGRPLAVLHDSSLIDASGAPVEGTLWKMHGFGEEERRHFEQCALDYLIRRALAAGHAVAFRAEALPLMIPFSHSANYDTWIAQLLAASGSIALLDETLVAYRLHDANVIGLRPRQPIGTLLRTGGSAAARFNREAAGLRDVELRLVERSAAALAEPLRAELRRRAQHLSGRGSLGATGGLRAAAQDMRVVARELMAGNYRRYSNGARSAVFDAWRSVRRPAGAQKSGRGTGPAATRTLQPGATVAAVIVEYHSGDALRRCVESLQESRIAEIVVVDNGARDATSRAPADLPATLRWIPSPENPGFGGGVNRGASVVEAELMLVCNPDIVLEPDALALLRATLEADPACAAVGPALMDRTGRVTQSARAFPTVRMSAIHAFLGLLRPSGSRSSEYRRRNWTRSETGVVDWVDGASILVRMDAFQEIGGFDSRYFLYVEEVDLCWRLAQAGWRVRYEPRARVQHTGAVSTSNRPYRALVAHHRSLWRFARKTASGLDRAALPFVAAGLLVRLGLACLIQAVARYRAKEHRPDPGCSKLPGARRPTGETDR